MSKFYDLLLAKALAGGGGGGGGDTPFSFARTTITSVGTPGANSGTYCYMDELEYIAELNDVMVSPYPLNVILVNGSAPGTFFTTEPITTYSGNITLGEPVEDEPGSYATDFTITGDCSVTLVGWQD